MTGPGQPSAFAEPWEARTFAMVKELLATGVLSPQEWSEALGAEQAAGGGDTDSSFSPWLAALESVVTAKQLATVDALGRRRAAWERAAHRTPHGEPITLAADDVRD